MGLGWGLGFGWGGVGGVVGMRIRCRMRGRNGMGWGSERVWVCLVIGMCKVVLLLT